MNTELLYQIGIGLVNGIGPVNAKKLIAVCGGVKEVFHSAKRDLIAISGMNSQIANAILNKATLLRAEQEIKFIERHAVKTFFYLEDDYPNRLKYCADAPLILYGRGNLNPNVRKVVSVVGTRKATEYGLGICNEIIQGLKSHDALIVSGLAYGIDIAAHKAALDCNLQTIACVGHGLDRIYPQQHHRTAERMEFAGGLLTEFMSGTKPDAKNFPSRNRVIAGMADVVLVIESDLKGGSMITADLGNSYNRDVMAVPGRIHDKFSRGCNKLIKDNRASILGSFNDLETLMQWNKSKPKIRQQELFHDLNEHEKVVVDTLNKLEKIPIDELSLKCQMSVGKISALLLELEFKGLVRSFPGKVYGLI